MLFEPAFLIEAPPSPPAAGGPSRLEGFGPAGQRRFSFGFTPTPVEFGGAHFHFNLPYDASRDGTLEKVVLSGPRRRNDPDRVEHPAHGDHQEPRVRPDPGFPARLERHAAAGRRGNMDILFSHGLPGGVR